MTYSLAGLSLGSILLIAFGCGDDGKAADGLGASCSTQTDCAQTQVCLRLAGTAACTPTCSISANECSATAACGPVASVSINACQPAPKMGEAPKPKDRPSLPCASDSDCASVAAEAICAEFEGRKDCTIACTQSSECNPPAIGGVTTKFMACAKDESADRNACLPDPACFSNPTSCIGGAGIPEIPEIPGL